MKIRNRNGYIDCPYEIISWEHGEWEHIHGLVPVFKEGHINHKDWLTIDKVTFINNEN